MPGIGFINIEAGDLLPVVALGAAAVGVYWLYEKVQQNAANNQANAIGASTDPSTLYAQAENLALLQSLIGQPSGQSSPATTQVSPGGATSGSNPAGNTAPPASPTASVAAPPTSGNGV